MEEVQVSLLASATDFINLFFDEEGLPGKEERLAEIAREIELTETYTHTPEELEFGAKVAWRNSNRCIGRLFWKTLKVRDMRHLSDPELVFKDLQEHLDYAWNDGKIRSAISVYRPAFPGAAAALRIWNPQLFRYAAWTTAEGAVLGDPAMLAFTEFC
ncbi:MAG: nitric oxide synthase oxygenase, partial [Saprospiraceae bacterium]|nr:nitric oxide synthase oxygenase [Saprospiraceae bacterium]